MVKRLLFMSGLAVIGVILFHTAGTGLTSMFFWAHRYLPATVNPMDQVGSSEYYLLRLLEQVVVACIPIFLFVSGYFIAVSTKRSDKTISWNIIWGRIKNLLIPYFVWSTVVLVLLFIQGERYTGQKLLVMLFTGSTSPVLYFVPLLIQFYVLAPFLVPLARNKWLQLLIITALMQIIVQLTQYPLFFGLESPFAIQLVKLIPKWFLLARIFWFPLGMVAGFHSEVFRNWLEKYRFIFLFITLALIPLGMVEWEYYFRQSGIDWLDHRETILDSIYSIGVIFTFLGFSKNKFPFEGFIGSLGARSFGVFLTHAIFIEYTAKLLYHLLPQILGNQWLLQPLLFIVGLGMPLLLIAIVVRLPIRNLYTYLFG